MADEESSEPAPNGDAPAPPPDAPEAAVTDGPEAAPVAGVEPELAEAAPEEVAPAEVEALVPDRPPEAETEAGPDGDPKADVAEDEGAVDVGPDALDEVRLALERLNIRVEELTRLSSRHIEHIDRLHAENQQLRAGELRQAISPVLRALIRHFDDLAKLMATTEAGSSEAKLMELARMGLSSVLNVAGLEAFEVAAKEPFDPTRHQGMSRTETDDSDLDGMVAQMRRCGFVGDDGRVIRPAEVDVYRLR